MNQRASFDAEMLRRYDRPPPLQLLSDGAPFQLSDGSFNHRSPILLLDPEGREIARSEKLGVPDPLFVTQVATAFEAHSPD